MLQRGPGSVLSRGAEFLRDFNRVTLFAAEYSDNNLSMPSSSSTGSDVVQPLAMGAGVLKKYEHPNGSMVLPGRELISVAKDAWTNKDKDVNMEALYQEAVPQSLWLKCIVDAGFMEGFLPHYWAAHGYVFSGIAETVDAKDYLKLSYVHEKVACNNEQGFYDANPWFDKEVLCEGREEFSNAEWWKMREKNYYNKLVKPVLEKMKAGGKYSMLFDEADKEKRKFSAENMVAKTFKISNEPRTVEEGRGSDGWY